jgi:uncharacterized protein (DUF1800 family)
LKNERWNRDCARHLLNRAGFGVPRERIETLADMGLDAAVDYLVNYDRLHAKGEEPAFLLPFMTRQEFYASQPEELSEEARSQRYNERQTEERQAIDQLKAWWLQRMRETPRPLEEKLALFWHGHFATSAQKVKSSEHTFGIYRIFREHAAGNFKALTIAVGQSPAMLDYLDNRKSTKERPNENWARELMELFTLGKGHYTEDDIKAAARAFTGWTTDGHRFEFRPERHDTGEKTFMGRSGAFDGWNILDILFEQPACARFIVAKLWRYFAYDEPEEEIVDGLAATLRQNGYELKPVLREIFLSRAFHGEKARATQIKSPAQFVVQLCDDLALEQPPYDQLWKICRALGQDLFYPPNVKGWDGGLVWINANSLLIRYNAPLRIVEASVATARQTARRAGRSDTPAPGMMHESDPELRMQHDPQPADSLRSFGEVARAWRKETIDEVGRRLAGLRHAERKQKLELLRKGTMEERRALLAELDIPLPPWEQADPARLFEMLRFDTAGTCLDLLLARFLILEASAAQKETLLAALGAAHADAPLRPAEVPIEKRHAVLHLITSMAEYQLC